MVVATFREDRFLPLLHLFGVGVRVISAEVNRVEPPFSSSFEHGNGWTFWQVAIATRPFRDKAHINRVR